MAFTFGLAAVYVADRLPGEPYIELPTAVSTDVFPIFIDNSRAFTREMNCGKDPADGQARLECSKERLFGDRDMSLYARYEIDRRPTGSAGHESIWDSADERLVRKIISRHWQEKSRAYLAVHSIGYHGENYTNHHFIEPGDDGSWLLSSTYTYSMWLYVDGDGTKVMYVHPHWSYGKARWKTATKDDSHYRVAPGTRYLEFENITGDTVVF